MSSIASSCLQHPFSNNNSIIIVTTNCKYPGIKSVLKLFFFQSHIDSVLERLSKQIGLVCSLRHYVPRKQLINNDKSNIKSFVQYGVLACGCSSRTKLKPVINLQKFFYRTKRGHCQETFVLYEILNVYEFFELLKFVLRFLTKKPCKGVSFLNDSFRNESSNRSTRRSALNLFEVQSLKYKKNRAVH